MVLFTNALCISDPKTCYSSITDLQYSEALTCLHTQPLDSASQISLVILCKGSFVIFRQRKEDCSGGQEYRLDRNRGIQEHSGLCLEHSEDYDLESPVHGGEY